MIPDPASLLQFWFRDIPEAAWWRKDAAFDAELRRRFGDWHAAAARGELFAWRDSLPGRLAEILLLDQLPRNLFRDSARAFASDGMALALSQEAVRTGLAASLPPRERAFLYLPYMHSESLLIHEEALRLFAEPGLEGNLDFERRHQTIIARFGRYPHRNAVLGRSSTPEEIAFLQEPGSAF
ncbi:MAG: hypothetical protein K0Q68_926 [Moraxellaceae bacterium]|jgi:uncharacterized protein (DUF924 family)|nr:hypothetical protein [Moraxellaceae bacterium]